MKNSELISYLQKFDGDEEVLVCEKDEFITVFSKIHNVEIQKWTDKYGKHRSIALVLDKYIPENTAPIDKDEEFIDKVNECLREYEKIDKKDAVKAKKVFDVDVAEMQKKYKEWFNNKYDKIARDSMIELFGSDKELNTKTISELKLHVYENGWQYELDKDELNNRSLVLRLLYNKLDERVKEKLYDHSRLWEDIFSDEKDENEDDNIFNNIYTISLNSDFSDDDWLNEFGEKLKKIDVLKGLFS